MKSGGSLKRGAKLAARVAATVTGSMLTFVAIGLALNLFLLLIAGPAVVAMLGASSAGAAEAAGAASGGGWFGARNLFLAAVFLVGAPYLYGLFGAKHGVKKAVALVGGDHIEELAGSIAETFTAKTRLDRLTADAVPRLTEHLRSLDGVPGGLRKVASFLSRQIVPDHVQAIAHGQPASEAVKTLLLEQVAGRLLGRDLTWLWILIAINVALFAAARWLFG